MENKLIYLTEATAFEEALPLGNGTLGAMIYGRSENEKISLNHDTLWSGKPRRYVRPNAKDAYQEAKKLVLADRIEEATSLLEKDFSANYGESYLPMGNLFITHHGSGTVSAYRRELNLETGIVSVCYDRDGDHFSREYFISHPDDALVVRMTSQNPASYTLTMDCQLKYAVTTSKDALYLTGECPTSIAPNYAKGLIPTVYDGDGIKFAAIAAVRTNGDIHAGETALSVENATELVVTLCAKTSFISFDVLPEKKCYYPCEEQVRTVAKKEYASLRAAHVRDFSALYDRVKLDLGFKTPDLPTDQRLMAEDKSKDLGLCELLFNFGRYLIIAASREGSQATNLQGIWNEEFFAPWSSNYTVNINTEMNYWPVLMCSLAGLDMPIIELVKKLSVTGAKTARDFYGAKGYCSHHNVDLWGLSTPVGASRKGCLCYAYWNLSAGWLCRHVFEHYEYTLDRDYLEKTAYPLMRGAAEFYLSLMTEDGEYDIICPSTSPENTYYHGENAVALARYTTMSQAILIDLFTNICRTAEILGIDDDFVKEVRAHLPRLNTYKIGSEGQLLEYDKDFPEVDIRHRHTSHLYGLYPGESITTESTPALAKACEKTLLRRGDVSTGWAMGWRVNLWAKLKDGDHALKLVKDQLHYIPYHQRRVSFGGGTYANLFDAHPPFQIDGNFGVCAGIAQMFLQCEDGKLRLLPALPADFANGSIEGLAAKGNITVNITWKNGKITAFSLISPIAQTVTVDAQGTEIVIALSADQVYTFEA